MDIKRFGLVITPSFISGAIVGTVSALALIFASWSYSVGSGLVYDFLFGPNSSGELIKSSRSTVAAFNETVFGNPTLNKILYFAFWMLVGLIVYVLLYLLIRGTSSAAEDVQETGYASIDNAGKVHNSQIKTVGLRVGIRLLVGVAWVIYWIFFTKILLPFSILSARVGVGELPHASGWLYGLLGLLVLTTSLHIHIVFLRLFLLRARVYASKTGIG